MDEYERHLSLLLLLPFPSRPIRGGVLGYGPLLPRSQHAGLHGLPGPAWVLQSGTAYAHDRLKKEGHALNTSRTSEKVQDTSRVGPLRPATCPVPFGPQWNRSWWYVWRGTADELKSTEEIDTKSTGEEKRAHGDGGDGVFLSRVRVPACFLVYIFE